MAGPLATLTEEEGVVSTSARVGDFTVAELRFPAAFDQGPFEPQLPYLAVVLGGSLVKSFRRLTMPLAAASAVTMPAGAAHGARFGARGARIVIVKAGSTRNASALGLDRLDALHAPALDWLARRLAGELRASDAGAPLAAEGLALELLAAFARAPAPERSRCAPLPWLIDAEEVLRARIADPPGLSELAGAVGVHPAHLARTFRARHGVSVGEYGRRVRVAWAARELERSETPLATIAGLAGFADQAHLTRLFRRYVGVTPARYRAETRGTFQETS